MGTAGHMQHPFDVPNVRTGQDLINYFERVVEYLSEKDPETGEFANLGSVKWDGINVSFKLVDDPSTPTGKDFRMDRGTSDPFSVKGMTTADAYEFWKKKPGHGMPPSIEILLGIFNKALPHIKPELKALGMWDDPTKYFNTEFMRKGKPINVIEYPENILAIHGVNQFYEKKAQAHRIRKGIGMDRPGLDRPEWHYGINPDTGKTYKAAELPDSIEIDYDDAALQSIIDKVESIAEEYEFSLVGDVPTELISEVDFEETLNTPFSVRTTENETQTLTLGRWLSRANNPFDAKVTKKIITQNPETGEDETTGKEVWAISKDVYVAIEVEKTPLDKYLLDPERDAITAINGALFNHATRLLGIDVLRGLNSTKGGLEGHEGVVLRGLEDRPVKVTGDFILKGMGGEIKKKMADIKENSRRGSSESDRMAKESTLKQNFAPMNQLLSSFEHGRSAPKRMVKEALLERKEANNGKRIIAIYPGRFQPMGRHHAEVFKEIQNEYGEENTFIATTDNVEFPKSPFNFAEKQKIAAAHGINPSNVIKVSNPYNAIEVVSKFDPETTVAVYFVGCKDMEADPETCEKPRFPEEALGGFTKKGTPRYFRKFEGEEDLKGYEEHAYITIAPHIEINIPDFGEMSGTTIRKALKDADEATFKDIMGFYDPEMYEMIKSKLSHEELEESTQYHLGIFLGLMQEVIDETNNDGTMFGTGRGNLRPAYKDDEEELEEISAMGAGAVEGAGHMNKKLKKRSFTEDNINEVLHYLLQISGE